MGKSVSTIALLAIVVEVVTDILKGMIPTEILNPTYSRVIALLVGITITVLSKIGMVNEIGLNISPMLDYILTGLLISRGSNAVHDISSVLRRNLN